MGGQFVRETHHADVEGVEQVKGQGGDQVHEKPGRDVVNADGAGVVHDLARRAHERGPEVQHDVCGGRQRQELPTAWLLRDNHAGVNNKQRDGYSTNHT